MEAGGRGDPFINPCRQAYASISPPSAMEAALSNWSRPGLRCLAKTRLGSCVREAHKRLFALECERALSRRCQTEGRSWGTPSTIKLTCSL